MNVMHTAGHWAADPGGFRTRAQLASTRSGAPPRMHVVPEWRRRPDPNARNLSKWACLYMLQEGCGTLERPSARASSCHTAPYDPNWESALRDYKYWQFCLLRTLGVCGARTL